MSTLSQFCGLYVIKTKLMNAPDIFEKLWIQYSCDNPSAGNIYDLFQKSGERVINDHVAFRTFDDSRVDINVIARPFIKAGYKPEGEYYFESKNLRARHYEMPGEVESPVCLSVS